MKIKILHIQETIASGGVERTRLSLAKFMDKTKYEQKIICTNASGNIVDEITREGVDIIPIGIFKHPFHFKQHRKVQKIIEDYKPDIIHGAVFEGVTMAAINGWLKKVPIIIIEETSFPLYRSWKGNLLMKLFAKMSDVIIGVSEAVTKEYLLNKLKVPDEKVQLVNNGVALPRKVDSKEIVFAKKKWNIADSDFVIGSVGRMLSDANKRFSDLINAFAKFSKDKKNVKLLLVGDGNERNGYVDLVTSLKIEDKVIFASYQSDITLFYQLMNVFSLVSTSESFGLVLAEAMLNKLPVIATKVGGMKYIVDDRKTGFLVEPFQVDEIAKKFESLYQNFELRIQMGEKGCQKAIEEYSEEIYVKNIEILYLKALKEKKMI